MTFPSKLWVGAAVGLLAVLPGCQAQTVPAHDQPVSDAVEKNDLPSGLPDRFAPGVSAYPFTGSRRSGVYHRSSCSRVAQIPSPQKMFFRNPDHARSQGLKPCPECRPDEGME